MIVINLFKKVFLFFCLFILSAMTNLMIKVIPFKILMSWFTNSEKYVPSVLTSKQRGRIRRVVSYLATIEKITPWRVMCFEKALTALLLCKIMKINVGVFFGVTRSQEGKLIAHAWTIAGGYYLTGGTNAKYHTIVFERALAFDCKEVE